MAVTEAKFAICTFLLYIILVLYIFPDRPILQWLTSFKTLLGVVFTLLLFRLPYSQVTKRSALLGCVFSSGVLLSIDPYYIDWRHFGWYLCALSFFHFSEYIMTALYNEDKLSEDSFLLNHSPEYKIAAVASWVEFLIEIYLFPVVKRQVVFSFLGLCMVIFGEVMRKLAMVTAKSNFTHMVQYTKRDKHILVTWGLYSWCRHPGYVGWFWWSIGTVFLAHARVLNPYQAVTGRPAERQGATCPCPRPNWGPQLDLITQRHRALRKNDVIGPQGKGNDVIDLLEKS